VHTYHAEMEFIRKWMQAVHMYTGNSVKLKANKLFYAYIGKILLKYIEGNLTNVIDNRVNIFPCFKQNIMMETFYNYARQ